MDHDLRIAALERRNEVLEERVRVLEEALFQGYVPPVEWGLTTSEARIMAVLIGREHATKENPMAALYDDLHRDAAEIKIVDVFICKIRKKLKPHGVKIVTRWGSGYQLLNRDAFRRAA